MMMPSPHDPMAGPKPKIQRAKKHLDDLVRACCDLDRLGLHTSFSEDDEHGSASAGAIDYGYGRGLRETLKKDLFACLTEPRAKRIQAPLSAREAKGRRGLCGCSSVG